MAYATPELLKVGQATTMVLGIPAKDLNVYRDLDFYSDNPADPKEQAW